MGSYSIAQFGIGRTIPFTVGIKHRSFWCGRALFHTTKKRKENFPNINLTGSYLRTRGVNNPTPSHRIIRCPYPDVVFPDIPLHEFVWQGLPKWQNKPALTCGATGRSYSYARARDLSRRVGSALLRLGLRAGDALAVCLPNAPEFPLVYLGALEAGLAVTTLGTHIDQEEMQHQLGGVRPAAVVGSGVLLERVLRAGAVAGVRWKAVLALEDLPGAALPAQALPPGCLRLKDVVAAEEENAANAPRFPDVRPDHLAAISFTSGTTAPPKGVRLSHANFVANISQNTHEAFEQSKETTETFQEELVCGVPQYHLPYGMVVLTLARLRLGAHIVTLPDPTPEQYISALEKIKSTVLALTPSLMLWMASTPHLPGVHLDRVHTVMCGGSPMAPDNTERLVSRLRPSVAFQQGYGCTETTATICQTSRWERRLGTAGFLVPNTRAKVVGDGDSALGAGHTGEILVKGPQVMLGYLNDEAAMQRSFDAEGWLRTGDLGFYDDEHRFHVVDRLGEIIHVSGIHTLAVAPAELEELLRSHPGVSACAVVSVPHDAHGQVPRAFVVRKPSFLRLTERELLDEVAQRTPPYKHLLGGVAFVDELPRTPTGNVKRYLLKGR